MKKTQMNYSLAHFSTALKAEHIKKRGTGFYWTSVILGALAPILFFIVAIVMKSDAIKHELPYNYYAKFLEQTLQPFAYFFFPLVIIITASRITQLDHKNGGWQLMETQPVTKFSIYFAKFMTLLLANIISILSFMVMSLLTAWILSFILTIPQEAIMELPWWHLCQLVSRLLLASLLVTAIQYVLSVLISSFIWALLIGFFGLLLTVFLDPFQLVPVWYPYQILSKIATNPDGSDVGHWFTFTEYISLTLSILLLYIGFRWYQYKTLKNAFFNSGSKALPLAVLFVVFGGLTFWLLRPNQMPDYPKTIFSGTIESKVPLHKLYLVDNTVQDTLAVIPLHNNTFHYAFDHKILTDNYTYILDGKYSGSVFMGAHDSIYLAGQVGDQKSKFVVKGTRLAENQMKAAKEEEWSATSYYLEENTNLDRPQLIIDGLYKEWKEAIKASSSFATVDNYIPKNDYTERNRKLITVRYLTMWHDLVKKRAAMYPNETTKGGAAIAEIQQQLSLTDESLLSSKAYFEYLKSLLIEANSEDLDDNTKSILGICQMKPGSFRDKMLFWQINKSIEEAATSAERNDFVAHYMPMFSNPLYQKKIAQINRLAESLGKGKQAPVLDAIDSNGKKVSLADLKGKVVVMDVWATWCGPCRQESPFFEKLALKYKRIKNIQFVAVSTDENLQKWYIAAKGKSKTVSQWHAADLDGFAKAYNVISIPRFIIIDANGNFINADMPAPSELAFESIVRKALHLPDEE